MTPNTASSRLNQVKDFVTGNKTASTIPWDPSCTIFPLRKDLPKIEGHPEEAAWVWGENDYIGRLNLLTPTRVKAAAISEIRTGNLVRLDLALHDPTQPAFHRETFEHKIKVVAEGTIYDDCYSLNTQSGSQWDGFRHFAHLPSKRFYNNTTGKDISGPDANPEKCGIHHWSAHGFTGRAIFLDYWTYATASGKVYDPYESHRITYDDLMACGHAQGLDIRPARQGGDIQIGDILLVRFGFVETYRKMPSEKHAHLILRHQDAGRDAQFAGLDQSQEILTWLHDCYFAAVGGDAPSFEAWPARQQPEGSARKSFYLHEYILALWGMPLGEMIDLEKVSQICRETNRWTFFLTSAPANCVGGVASHANATAIF